jgi:ATP-dependent Lon protease
VKKGYGKYRKSDKDLKDEESKQIEGSLTYTGRLGEVMKESLDVVKIAVFNYI